MMDRMKIIFHKELKAKNAETNKLFSQLSALLVLVMGNIKKELKRPPTEGFGLFLLNDSSVNPVHLLPHSKKKIKLV